MTDVLFGAGYQVKIRTETGEVAGSVPTATRVFLDDLNVQHNNERKLWG